LFLQRRQFIENNTELVVLAMGLRRVDEFKRHLISAPGATRKLLSLQERDFMREAVLAVMHSINAALLNRLSCAGDKREAAGSGSRFA
jgi:hypothetical protein